MATLITTSPGRKWTRDRRIAYPRSSRTVQHRRGAILADRGEQTEVFARPVLQVQDGGGDVGGAVTDEAVGPGGQERVAQDFPPPPRAVAGLGMHADVVHGTLDVRQDQSIAVTPAKRIGC